MSGFEKREDGDLYRVEACEVCGGPVAVELLLGDSTSLQVTCRSGCDWRLSYSERDPDAHELAAMVHIAISDAIDYGRTGNKGNYAVSMAALQERLEALGAVL